MRIFNFRQIRDLESGFWSVPVDCTERGRKSVTKNAPRRLRLEWNGTRFLDLPHEKTVAMRQPLSRKIPTVSRYWDIFPQKNSKKKVSRFPHMERWHGRSRKWTHNISSVGFWPLEFFHPKTWAQGDLWYISRKRDFWPVKWVLAHCNVRACASASAVLVLSRKQVCTRYAKCIPTFSITSSFLSHVERFFTLFYWFFIFEFFHFHSVADSFFKPPPGLTTGHILMLGSYDLCLSVNAMPYTDRYRNSSESLPAANYCLVRLQLTLPGKDNASAPAIQPLPPLATCYPRSCSREDVDRLILALLHVVNYAADKVASTNRTACAEPIPPQPGTSATLNLVGYAVVVCLWATVVHLVARQYDPRYWDTDSMDIREEKHQRTLASLDKTDNGTEMKGFPENSQPDLAALGEGNNGAKIPAYIKMILCFSLVHNANRLFAPAPATGQLNYLNGIRVLSMWWVMLGHVYQLGGSFFCKCMQ